MSLPAVAHYYMMMLVSGNAEIAILGVLPIQQQQQSRNIYPATGTVQCRNIIITDSSIFQYALWTVSGPGIFELSHLLGCATSFVRSGAESPVLNLRS